MLLSLLSEQVYAIVDIEATGGSVGADERIIQFACVLVKNGQIIHTFETLVNPGKNIPKNIRKLTGITNNDVKTAPYFEEIAPMILSLLEGAVFVAHNVGFDYRFLNEQLKAHGFKQLNIPAVDTVELTQILYPSMDSFQLEDIAGYLNYDLSDAHNALADAEATVHIFIKLFNYAKTLPLVTLEKLNELAACTTHETRLFFDQALEIAKMELKPLADDLVVVNQIAIKKPENPFNEWKNDQETRQFPTTQEEKIKYLKNNYTYRSVQAEMMDEIYNYFDEEFSLEKLAVEAPPGIGKTMGYLFPASFQADQEQPIVISTYTTLLQEQLLNETLPELEEMIDRKIPTTLAKSRNHYISLSIFERWLNTIQADDSEAYLSMRLLVWLTQTTTGDLSEINAGSHLDLTFWQEIRVTNHQYIDEHWTMYDFYERVKQSIKNSQIIVTNHQFLIHDWQSDQSVLPSFKRLIVDEAHHFPEIVTRLSTKSIHGIELFTQLEKIGSIKDNTGISQLINYLEKENIIKAVDLLTIERNTELIKESWESIFNSFLSFYEEGSYSTRKDAQFVENEFNIEQLSFKKKKVLKNISRGLEEFVYISQKISKHASDHFEHLTNNYQLLLIELNKLTTFMTEWKKIFQRMFDLKDDTSQAMRWVTYLPNHIEHSIQFHFLQWGESNSLVDYLATNSQVVFTSSTLSYKESEDYFSSQLKNLPLRFLKLTSPFDYGNQVRVMLPEENINPKNLKNEEYSSLLAKELVTILKNVKANTVVLFRSLSILREVYSLLSKNKELSEIVLLAQSISGTRNRILKTFKRHKPAVILGADSFFEGIDLPEEELELVILTRLPFPAPDTPIMRLKTDDLKKYKLNPFTHEYLPQAILKFKQAFGRLIRNEADKGVLVVLDDRFLSASYSKIFIESLPQGVPVEIYANEELGQKVQKFIDTGKG